MEKAEDVAAFKDFTDDGAKSAEEPAAPKAEKKEKEASAPAPTKKESPPEKKTTSSSGDDRVAVSPLAKKLAQEKGIDLQVKLSSSKENRSISVCAECSRQRTAGPNRR